MTIISERTAQAVTSPRELVSPELFDRLVTYHSKHHDVARSYAERVIEQTVIFLVAAANNTRGIVLSPSLFVDPGWHTLVLHTEDYARWCEETFGRRIAHTPMEPEIITSGKALAQTIPALRATGFQVDEELWEGPVSCGPCDGPWVS